MYKINLLSFVLLLSSSVFGSDQKNFIIATTNDKKIAKMSKNALKEHFGESTRDAFHVTTELARQMGMLQIELASFDFHHEQPVLKVGEGVGLSSQIHKHMGQFHIELALVQKRFSHIIELLVDNQAPFKKAGSGSLRGAYTMMMQIEKDLKAQVNACCQVTRKLSKAEVANKGVFIKKTGESLKVYVDVLKKIQTTMNAHECLKQI